jgi:hypothetical protein
MIDRFVSTEEDEGAEAAAYRRRPRLSHSVANMFVGVVQFLPVRTVAGSLTMRDMDDNHITQKKHHHHMCMSLI